MSDRREFLQSVGLGVGSVAALSLVARAAEAEDKGGKGDTKGKKGSEKGESKPGGGISWSGCSRNPRSPIMPS